MDTRFSLSLQARVLAGLVAVAIVSVTVAVAITSLSQAQLLDQVDEQLLAGAEFDRGPWRGEERGEERGEDHHEIPTIGGGSAEPPVRSSPWFEGYLGDDGELAVRFASNAPGQAWSLPVVEASSAADAGGRPFTSDSIGGDVHYRVVATELGDGWAIRAFPLDGVDETMHRIKRLEAVGVVAVLAVLAAVAWWVIRLGVVPIKRMTSAAAAIAEGDDDLAARIPEPTASGTESAGLARALNTMLGRIERAAERQASSEQRLRRFVADASHELRTPVTTIRGYAELYRHGGLPPGERLDDAMRRTEQEASRMGRLVDDMLLLAKLDQERPIEHRPVDVSALLEDVVDDSRVVAPERALSTEIEPELVVAGDEDRLRQVVTNLVGNALTHTGPDVPIVVTATRHAELVRFRVIDRGPGMEPEVVARVTERFFRADPSRSRPRGGSGLGLAIVDAVVAAHGGTVAVESTPNEGTTVTVTLPRFRTDADADADADAERPQG